MSHTIHKRFFYTRTLSLFFQSNTISPPDPSFYLSVCACRGLRCCHSCDISSYPRLANLSHHCFFFCFSIIGTTTLALHSTAWTVVQCQSPSRCLSLLFSNSSSHSTMDWLIRMLVSATTTEVCRSQHTHEREERSRTK